MRILNLYAGIGGNRKFWEGHEITAVEHNKDIAAIYKRFYPADKLIIGDAREYLLKHYKEFDFIWSSPPCQSHSRMVKRSKHEVKSLPDMGIYSEIVFLQKFFKGKWIVENVYPYYTPLIRPTRKIGRHLFWCNFSMVVHDVPVFADGFLEHTGGGRQEKRNLMKWLGIHFEENVYYGGNHDYCQVLRNCVHPNIGEQILASALNAKSRHHIKKATLIEL